VRGRAPVQATRYLSVEQAQRVLFPQADAFETTRLPKAWAAMRAGQLLGHMMVDEVIGKA